MVRWSTPDPPTAGPRDHAQPEGQSPTSPHSPEALLRSIPFLRGMDRVDSARLIGAVEDMELNAGAVIVAEGTAEDRALFLLDHGRVEVTISTSTGEQSFAELEAPSFFGEMAVLLARRTATVRALTDVRLWRVPAAALEQLLRDRPALALAAAQWGLETVERSRRELVGAPIVPPAERPPLAVSLPTHPRPLRWRLAGAGLAIGTPLALWQLPPPSGLALAGWHVSLIVLGAAIAWLFEPVPDFVVALLMAAAWGATGLVPLPLALAGFASSSWLVSVGSFALAVALARSGLLFRVALLLLKTFPATGLGQLFALLIGGLVLTPMVPLALARVAVVAPLAEELANELGYPPHSRGSARIALAGLVGYGLFSSVFLTGMVMNFFVLDLLPPPVRVHFDWLGWLVAAAPACIVIFVGALVMLLVFFRTPARPRPIVAMLRRQEQVLGPVSPSERVLLAAVAILVGGVLLQPLLGIDPAWLAVGALACTLAGGGLDRATFQSAIDWGFLTFFGVLLGTAGVLHSVGVDAWIGMRLVPLAQRVGDPAALVLLLGVFVILCRVVLPWVPATLILSLALVPAAGQVGLSPWVVGFVVLLVANTWLHPNQSDFHRLLRDATGAKLLSERDALRAGIGLTAIALVAVAASIPYWRALGLLGR